MSDILTAIYPWIKALHIISVISWMVALLYLPRLFVYHAELTTGEEMIGERFKIMEHRLARYIMTPAMIASWAFGLVLVLTPGIVDLTTLSWFLVKLVAIVALTIFHFWLIKRQADFAAGKNTHSSRTYRIVNEMPTLLMIIIVILVVVKPF